MSLCQAFFRPSRSINEQSHILHPPDTRELNVGLNAPLWSVAMAMIRVLLLQARDTVTGRTRVAIGLSSESDLRAHR
jgi:hypothetical protein